MSYIPSIDPQEVHPCKFFLFFHRRESFEGNSFLNAFIGGIAGTRLIVLSIFSYKLFRGHLIPLVSVGLDVVCSTVDGNRKRVIYSIVLTSVLNSFSRTQKPRIARVPGYIIKLRKYHTTPLA